MFRRYDYTPSQYDALSRQPVTKTQTPIWVWIVMAVLAILAIVFLILWLTKDDSRTVLESGINDVCENQAACAAGLNCVTGKCICAPPLAPANLVATAVTGNKIEISFTPNVGADLHDIFLEKGGVHTLVSQNTPGNGLITDEVDPGVYTVIVIPKSFTCASVPGVQSVSGDVTVGI